MDVGIHGLQDAQRDNLRMIAALRPSTGIGEAVRVSSTDLHRYTLIVTHVDTGALRASHRIEYNEGYGGAEARISIDVAGRNPRTGQRTSVYGAFEHARGGSHAFYERTYSERGDRAMEIGMLMLARRLTT